MRFPSLAAALVLIASAAHAENLATRASPYPVGETLDRLATALKAKGIEPAARIDHAAAAKAAGLDLKPTELLLFGNPRLGTPLMQANRQIAIELPMKVLAWEDDAGKVWVGYTAPETLKTRYGIDGRDEVFKTMTGALDALTGAATAKP